MTFNSNYSIRVILFFLVFCSFTNNNNPKKKQTESSMLASFSYEDTPGTSFSGVECPSTVTTTINVADNFVISDLNVGLNVTLDYRHHLSITLTSPNGTTVELTSNANYGLGGTATIVNWDALFDDASVNPLNDGDSDDVGLPYYEGERTVNPSGSLADFNGENAMGTWTLTFCDFNVSFGATGTLNRFKLDFEGAAACDVTITQSDESSCMDNSTNSNTSDDFFQITFNATTTGSGTQYELVIGANVDGTGGTVLNPGGTDFGSAITIGSNSTPPFVANGSTTYAITVRVEGDETCHADYTTSTVASCSPCSGTPISGTVTLTKN